MTKVNLPAVLDTTSSVLAEVTSAFGIPRDVLASDDEIVHAWRELPRVLTKIPPELRSEHLARMCVAVSTGLLDAAVNYAWNSAIVELRRKVHGFGLNVLPQVIGREFDEKTLNELKDIDLLRLCLSLNLIDEDGFFFLDQCREVRNSFSSAHPPIGSLDDHEFLVFLNRCVKYALSSTVNLRGVDAQSFIAAVKAEQFTPEQHVQWIDTLSQTHDAQREMLLETLHGIYCDPDSSQQARLNAIWICRTFAANFTTNLQSGLINRHNEYITRGKTDRQAASQHFFVELGLVSLLTHAERHTIISRATQRLLSVHDDFNNFYNEPPFIERLAELSEQGAIPDSAKQEFVNVVMLCATGNQYGQSWAASPYYVKVIKNFSPREVALMLDAATSYDRLSRRLQCYPKCRERFAELVRLVDEQSVPISHKANFNSWVEM